jgi:rhodanese-related sulfurtransferase
VREPDEVAQGRAPEALLIPLGSLGERLAEIPEDRTVLVVCRTGARSAVAAQALTSAGYQALNLAGGMEAWRDAGLPVVRADGSRGFVA